MIIAAPARAASRFNVTATVLMRSFLVVPDYSGALAHTPYGVSPAQGSWLRRSIKATETPLFEGSRIWQRLPPGGLLSADPWRRAQSVHSAPLPTTLIRQTSRIAGGMSESGRNRA